MKETARLDQERLASASDEEFVFGGLFLIANRLQTLMDREFGLYGLTARQWFLSIVIGGVFDAPPTLGEAAAVMGSTHQNVKQVALKLQEKGFLELIGDPRDRRAVRLKLTPRSGEFWAGMQQRSERFMAGLYKDLGKEGLSSLRDALTRLMANIEQMET